MAQLAGLRSRRVGGALGGTDRAVVAVCTAVGGLAVIEGHDHRFPHISGMAGVAQLAGHRVCGRFIGGIRPGMAHGASGGGLIMRERRD